MSSGSLVAIALNQKVNWHKKKGMDAYGQTRFNAPVLVPCRVSMKNRLILSATGSEVTSTALVTTLAPVEIGDKLTVHGRDYIVLDVRMPATFGGQIQRRKAYV